MKKFLLEEGSEREVRGWGCEDNILAAIGLGGRKKGFSFLGEIS